MSTPSRKKVHEEFTNKYHTTIQLVEYERKEDGHFYTEWAIEVEDRRLVISDFDAALQIYRDLEEHLIEITGMMDVVIKEDAPSEADEMYVRREIKENPCITMSPLFGRLSSSPLLGRLSFTTERRAVKEAKDLGVTRGIDYARYWVNKGLLRPENSCFIQRLLNMELQDSHQRARYEPRLRSLEYTLEQRGVLPGEAEDMIWGEFSKGIEDGIRLVKEERSHRTGGEK